MAQGIIPVIDKDGARVGDVVYSGTADSGVWSFSPDSRFKGKERTAVVERIAQAKRANSHLGEVSFMAEGFTRSLGWKGYWGLLGALEHALPTVGFKVDRVGIEPVRLAQPIEGEYDLIEGPEGDQPEPE